MLISPTPIVIAQINCWDVLAAEIVNDPANPQMITTIRYGYSPDGGVTINWIGQDRAVLNGEGLLTAWAQPPLGATIYEAVINAIVGHFVTAGVIPADAVPYVPAPAEPEE